MARIFIGNLIPDASRTELEREFSRFGRIRDVWIARNPPGFGFIIYDDRRDAEDAIRDMDGFKFMGSRLKVEFARDESGYRPSSRTSSIREKRCYYCDRVGHIARECRSAGSRFSSGGAARSKRHSGSRSPSPDRHRRRSPSGSRSPSRRHRDSRDRDRRASRSPSRSPKRDRRRSNSPRRDRDRHSSRSVSPAPKRVTAACDEGVAGAEANKDRQSSRSASPSPRRSPAAKKNNGARGRSASRSASPARSRSPRRSQQRDSRGRASSGSSRSQSRGLSPDRLATSAPQADVASESN